MSDPDTDSYEAVRENIAKNEISTYARRPITSAFTCRILAYTVLAYRVLACRGVTCRVLLVGCYLQGVS